MHFSMSSSNGSIEQRSPDISSLSRDAVNIPPPACTARHGVGSYAVPPTTEWAMPTGKKFARQSHAA